MLQKMSMSRLTQVFQVDVIKQKRPIFHYSNRDLAIISAKNASLLPRPANIDNTAKSLNTRVSLGLPQTLYDLVGPRP